MSSVGIKKRRPIRTSSRHSKTKVCLNVGTSGNAASCETQAENSDEVRSTIQKVRENGISILHECDMSSTGIKTRRPIRASCRLKIKDSVFVDPLDNVALYESQGKASGGTKIPEEVANLRSTIQNLRENEVPIIHERGMSTAGIEKRKPIRTSSRHSKTKGCLSVDPSYVFSCGTQGETSDELKSTIHKARKSDSSTLHDCSLTSSGIKRRKPIKTVSRLSKSKDCLPVGSLDKAAASEIQGETSDEEKISDEIVNLRNSIQKVRDLSLIPSVYHYNVQTENNIGLSAVDINRNGSTFAFAENGSSDIIVKILLEDELLKISPDDDLMTMYRNFKDAKKNSRNRKKVHPSSPAILKGHALPVTGLNFVCHKDLLMSCSLDGTARAWNTKDFRSVELYSAHSLCFRNIDVSWNSSFFATSCLSGHCCLFSFEQKVPVRYFIGHSDDVECVKFHPNGLYIATASEDKTIKLWTSQTAKAVRTFTDDCCPTSLLFSPDGTYLASYSGKYIKIWDLASGRLLSSLVDSDSISSSQCLCFNKSGEILASGGQHKKINMWDMKHISTQISSDSSLEGPEFHLLKCHSLKKKIYLLKFMENSFFTCVTA